MHISIVDDERILSEKIAKKVRSHGFSAISFLGYRDFMENGSPKSQLYIIDSSLRDGNGIDIIQWLRNEQKCTAPIIMISGYGDAESKISGLNSGADDYIVKPFLPDELIARIHAVLRRPNRWEDLKVLRHKSISFDRQNQEVSVGDKRVHLTRTEQIILETFLENVGTVICKEKMVSHVWGSHKYHNISDNVISAHISNIKKKLGDDFAVHTEYGTGYILNS